MEFSFTDYQKQLTNGSFSPPSAFFPYFNVDILKYKKMEGDENKDDFYPKRLSTALREARSRVSRYDYQTTYPLQTQTLDYSSRTFPCYKFMLPEVIADDWIAVAGWHKFQRDHVLHQPLTGYVVLKLFDEFDVNSNSILDICVEQLLNSDDTKYLKDFIVSLGTSSDDVLFKSEIPATRIFWKGLFREAAYIAAVFHDLGYPWQYVGLLSKNLQSFNHDGSGFHQNAEEIIKAFKSKLLFYPFYGYKQKSNTVPSDWKEKLHSLVLKSMTSTHGFPGALGFLYLNDSIRKYPDKKSNPFRLFMIDWIATAIMMHDMKKIYWTKDVDEGYEPENPQLKVSFSKDPLSAILTLADIIQDFHRLTATFKPDNSKNGTDQRKVDLTYKHGTGSTKLTLDDQNNLKIHYIMTSQEALAIKNESLRKERKECFDQTHGYLDLTGLGINKVTMSASI